MKILVVSSRIPAAGRKGDQVVSFFRLMHLVKTHEIEVVCFGDIKLQEDREAVNILEAAGIVVHLVRWSPWVAVVQLFRAITDAKMPFQCAFFRSGGYRKCIHDVAERFKPDALYCVMIRVLPNIEVKELPIFIDMVDSIGLNFSRREQAAKGLKKLILSIEHRRIQNYERHAAQLACRSFVVSELDRSYIGDDKICVLPLGIDVNSFQRKQLLVPDPVIVFSGNMSYQPNIEAVLWFVKHCWDLIKMKVPNSRLVVAGGAPAPSVLALAADDRITITGRVPSMSDVLNESQVAVAPMQSGSGMQFKILEAMACGIPVVTTTLGLGDISAIPGRDILIGNTPIEITNYVVGLLGDPTQRDKIASAGYNYVINNHSWSVINSQFSLECSF